MVIVFNILGTVFLLIWSVLYASWPIERPGTSNSSESYVSEPFPTWSHHSPWRSSVAILAEAIVGPAILCQALLLH